MTIRTKLLVNYLALTSLGMVFLAAYVLWSFRVYFFSTAEADLAARSIAISESVSDWLELGDGERVETLVKRYGAQDGITLRVFSPDGTLLATSEPTTDARITNWKDIPGMKEAFANRPAHGVAKGVLSRDDRLYEARPLSRNGRMLGVLRISLTLENFKHQLSSVIKTVLFTMLLMVGLFAMISARLARNIASPIQEMRNFAVRLGGGHLGEKLNIPRRDELGQLATELNRMSERLASLDDERRAFLANVSHELRTPVSNVQVTLDALENGADEEPELRTRFIRTALDETTRLSGLIQDLLDLGRLEAGVVQLERQTISLHHLLNRCARAMESRMRSKGISIRLELEHIQLEGDPERLLQAFLNVLDNAIKFSLPKTVVSVIGRLEGSFLSVYVQDQGSGISEADLPHVFEQFYTGDPSRKRGGTGLGLAIARRIVESHGGTITASSASGRGATFKIRLPVVTPTTGSREERTVAIPATS
jgi:signal transduction histidine kinase